MNKNTTKRKTTKLEWDKHRPQCYIAHHRRVVMNLLFISLFNSYIVIKHVHPVVVDRKDKRLFHISFILYTDNSNCFIFTYRTRNE